MDLKALKARCSKCGHWTTNIGYEWLAIPKGRYRPLCKKCELLEMNPSSRKNKEHWKRGEIR
jgi:hypothetical protein